MKSKVSNSSSLPARGAWLAIVSGLLVACGSGESTTSAALQIDVPVTTDLANLAAQPSFHIAPVLLDAPDDMDAVVSDTSALFGPHVAQVPAALAHLSTRKLTREAIESAANGSQAIKRQATPLEQGATPLAAGTVVATYSPAQIRTAYGLPALPPVGAVLSTSQAAQSGAGQTVYIVDAMHNPNVAAELTAFNQKFGLPACTVVPVATNAALPLPAAPSNSCVLSVVYTTSTGAMTASAPAYDSGWSTEISLDVQWVHATAPLARIVLIEAPDASLNSLIAAVNLANAMGRGVVSMSFGASEGSWTASVDNAFAVANMSYVASSGDSGAGVNWPAVSSRVLAVGGTTLTYSNGVTRSEIAWSGSGGGVSRFTARPAYQTSAVPGMGSPSGRSVADVAFNADPATGQYVAVIAPGSPSVGWVSAGGTSLSAPQWAGVLAVANAVRAQGAQSAIGAPHSLLYGTIAGSAAKYAGAFADVSKGANGTCATCGASAGYDTPTGLGTPNVASLMPLLSGSSVAPTAPIVVAGAVKGTAGLALSFAVTATAANSLNYSMSGAPAGMSVSAAGLVAWASPVVGTYAVTITATDSITGLSGKGLYTVSIAAPAPPVVAAGALAGTAGVAVNYQVNVSATNPVALSMTGAPVGATMSSSGVLGWLNPLQGVYTITVTAKDTKTGLSGQGLIKMTIAAPQAPVVNGASISGRVGSALSFAVSVTSANSVNYSLTGAPGGLSISAAGVVAWSAPIAGNYSVTVTASDPKTGLSGQGVYKIAIVAPGPMISVTPIVGTAGKAVSGTFSVSDPGATSLSVSIAGVPLGMTFSISGLTITANWPSAVKGNYSLLISVTDSAGFSAKASLPVTIN